MFFPLTARRLARDVSILGAVLACALSSRAEPLINEFMASNKTTLVDDRGDYSDWIEIFNPDATPVSLDGWYLTDSASDKTRWQFPAVTIAGGSYLVVFASNNSRRDPTRPLHTNFSLSASGEYLGLVKPDGTTVVSEYAPAFPAQEDDVSYGVAQTPPGTPVAIGFFRQPTPGAANGGRDALMVLETVAFSRAAGPFTAPFNLALTGAAGGERIRYVLAAPSSAGANVPDPTANSPEYTAPIQISSNVIVRAAVFSADNGTRGRATSVQFVKLDPGLVNFATQLPVIVLDNFGLGELVKDRVDHPAWIYTYDNNSSSKPLAGTPSLATPTTMSVRGNFSSNFLKSSFSLELHDNRDRSNPQPLLGLDPHQDWALVGPWMTDRSYIRNAYIYALSNRIGRWAPRTRFVETFVNQNGDGLDNADYYGIGVLTDRIKISKDRVNITALDPGDNGNTSITGGYIVKLDVVPDPEHYNFITDHGIPSREGTAVVVDSPGVDKLSDQQRTYIRGYVQQMENALFADQAMFFTTRTYLDYIDVPSWVDHHILEMFSANVDALYRSDYFYKDRGGKLVSGPAWDFDGSMGNGDDRDAAWDTWNTAGNVDLWNYGWFGVLTHDPEFQQAWVDRWQALRKNEFTETNLRGLADSLAAEVGTDAAARDAARWPDDQSRYGSNFLGEVAHLKDWVAQRAAWIDQQFLAAPTMTNTGSSITFTAPAGAQLAYTTDGSDPRALGGAIAPGTTVTSSPVSVLATTNIHVRSYRADFANKFPGSPWSSAVGGASSTPLSPRARIVNLSTRAIAGSGDATLIVGVTIADTANKGFLARAVGPTLAAFGAQNVLPDPVLKIFRTDGVEIYRNIGWETGPDASKLPALSRSVGAFPLAAGAADSALMAPLPAGGYTVQVSSVTDKTGVSLAELYAYDDNGRTLNLSTRARVGTGEGVLVGGFVVTGAASKRMLIRAVGPTLAVFGVGGVLADPVIKVYSGQTVVAANDDWSTDGATVIAAASTSVGAFALPAGSADSALLITLRPGAYTVEVSGKNDTQGVALLEIYEVP